MSDEDHPRPTGFLGSSIFPSFNPPVNDEEAAAEDADNNIDTGVYRHITDIPEPPISKPAFPTFSSFPSFKSFAPPLEVVHPPLHLAAETRSKELHSSSLARKRERESSIGPIGDRDKRSSKKSKKRAKDRDRDRDRDRDFIRNGKDEHRYSDHDPAEAPEFTPEMNSFYIDRKADELTLTTGAMPVTSVQSYWLKTNIILGTKFKIDLKYKGRGFLLKLPAPVQKLTYKDFARAMRVRPTNVKRLTEGKSADADVDDNMDYIAFKDADNPLSRLEELQFDPNSISENPEYVRRAKELNAEIQRNGTDRELWLQLIKLQDTLLVDATNAKKSFRTFLAEKKQAIYQKALEEIPHDEILIAGLMDSYAETMDATSLLTEWDRALKLNIGSLLLWDKYLQFRQSNYASFTITSAIEVYEECIATLNDGYGDEFAREQMIAHLFVRACFMLHQAGFTERAVGTMQALIEFACFCPAGFASHNLEKRIDLFEVFWESECPRFGEEGAMGWRNNISGSGEPTVAVASDTKYVEAEGSEPSTKPATRPSDVLVEIPGEDEFLHWYRKETVEEYANWLPLRLSANLDADDEVTDPYRSVVFDDVRNLLFDVRFNETKLRLITSFLNLLSLQFNYGMSSDDQFFTDVFVHGELANETAAKHFLPANNQTTDDVSPTFDFPLKNYPQSFDTLLGTTKRYGVMDDNVPRLVDASGDGRRNFIKNVLQQSRQIFNDDGCILSSLIAFEACYDKKSALKLGKGILKSNRMSLPIWAVYAEIEFSRGNSDEAKKILSTAVASCKTFPKENQADAPIVHFSLAEAVLASGNEAEAIAALGTLVDENANQQPLAPTKVLKIRKGYMEQSDFASDRHFSKKLCRDIFTLACGCLFEYLTQSLDDALSLYDSALTNVSSQLGREMILQMKARLAYNHATRGGAFKPAVLRGALESAMEQYPHNIGFLMLFVYNEARTKIENRLRRYLDGMLTSRPSHALWIFAIWAELRQRSQYNVNSIRSLFERAVESERHSVSIWYLAIVFEAQNGNLSKGKSLFYRAIRECPWAKALYMLPFKTLRDVFDAGELGDVTALMEEKELRRRIE